MDNQQRNLLAAKKHQIQLRIKVDEFIDSHLLHWLEIYEIILINEIEHELVQLANVEEEEIGVWDKKMKAEPFDKFNFDVQKLNTNNEDNIFSKFYKNFPSVYPLRFMPSDEVPTLVSDKLAEIIQDFANQLGANLDEEVYLIYLYYTPVLKLKLKDIISHAEQLYDFPMEDIVIVAPKFDWIIFRSMEEEWRFCRSTTTIS